MIGARVNHPGWGTTIQDLGRLGVMSYGLTPGGAADIYALQWANALLHNPRQAAALEILPGGFTLELEQDCMLAITGADLGATCNDQPISNWSSWWAPKGGQLHFGLAQQGLRAYLAVAGGWQTPVCYGSRSTVLREGLGGLAGRALISGDALAIEPQSRQPQRCVAQQWQPNYASPLVLRYVPGYQHAAFDDLTPFHSADYQLSPQSNRMGVRLEGPVLSLPDIEPQSEGIAMGTIQITGAGQPIVLLQERQTVGGYWKLGSVGLYDCAQLAQRAPGSSVSFQPVFIQDLQAERLQWQQFFNAQASS